MFPNVVDSLLQKYVSIHQADYPLQSVQCSVLELIFLFIYQLAVAGGGGGGDNQFRIKWWRWWRWIHGGGLQYRRNY